MTRKPVIFCDFDGTITEKDMIIAIMEKFAPPEWVAIKEQILAMQIGTGPGVKQLFSLISSELKEQITNFVIEQVKIRKGFPELLSYCREKEIPFYVVTGGLDFFVRPILLRYRLDQEIYSNSADFSGDTIQVVWPYPCDEHCGNECGICKSTILRNYSAPDAFKIVIGDSIPDLASAKLADFVFARALLLKKCKELGITHRPFEDFHDVIQRLDDLRAEGCKG